MEDPEGHFSALVALARNHTFMTERRKRIAYLGSRLQYNFPGSIISKINEHGSTSGSGVHRDAVDVIMNALKTGMW